MINKKTIFISLVIIIVVLIIGLFSFHQKAIAPNPGNLVGGDRDVHGCIGSAGYSWCAVKNKCLRIWEEKCDTSSQTNCTPNWICGWAKCTNGSQGMTAVDSNNCGLPSSDAKIACPALARICSN